MAKAQEVLYAVIGAGDLALEKASGFRSITDRKKTEKLYNDFVTRGRSFYKKIGNSAATKQALAQTKTARSQLKAATTSVTKAVRANVKATRSIAQRAAKAS